MKQIDADVLEVLLACHCTWNEIHLPKAQLDRKLYTRVNKVLENLGGKWVRKDTCHVFPVDVSDAFREVQCSGQYEAKLDELNKIYNFFETPVELAYRMVRHCHLNPVETVLEPSAGRGAIAHQIRNAGVEPAVIETHPDMRARLATNDFKLVGRDFLEHEQHYDVIIANPPFSGGRDARHILHMIELADRMVVAVCSMALTFRDTGPYPELRAKIAELGGQTIALESGTFKESGTMVSTCLVVVEK